MKIATAALFDGFWFKSHEFFIASEEDWGAGTIYAKHIAQNWCRCKASSFDFIQRHEAIYTV